MRALVNAVRAAAKALRASSGRCRSWCSRASWASVRATAKVALVSGFETQVPVWWGGHGPQGGTLVWSFGVASLWPGRMAWYSSSEPNTASSYRVTPLAKASRAPGYRSWRFMSSQAAIAVLVG